MRGFTILELLVVVGIISLLLSILGPSYSKVKRQAERIISSSNQKQAINGVSLFAIENDDRYPESVATVGGMGSWNWQEPMMLTGYRARSPRVHRSMSEYLRGYIDDADVMYCASSPKKYKYLQESWDAGDEWDNPDTGPFQDPLSGTFCFYWNYTGYLGDYPFLFRGPRRLEGGRGESKLLVSDYFGYDHHRSRNSFGSCERFKGAEVTEGSFLSSSYWSRLREMDDVGDSIAIKLNAGYTDGHVESYGSSDVETMKVIWKRDVNEPYPEGVGPGDFYLPRNGIR